MNGSTPISFSRVSAPGASFVCKVERTRCPVSAASIEIFAVSPSRISPTMTTSGSERRIDRSALANVMPARRLICTWLMPSRRYSTGSSTVMMFTSGRLISASEAYKVVDFPEPVGPVTRSAPVGRERTRESCACISSDSPSSSSVGARRDLSSRRIVTASPSTVGSVATRMSRTRPAAAAFREMRPSCGLRRSAMSSFASTLRRVVTPETRRFGISWATRNTPSTRKRTTSAASCGSKWTSLAPSSAAWKMIELTSRTSGASEMPSSTSRSSSSTCSTVASATASSMSAVFSAWDVRVRRRTSASTSAWAATWNSTGWRVASRSSSSARTFCGSLIATCSVAPANANGRAHTRSSTASGMAVIAFSSIPTTARSTSGRWNCSASERAMPSELATPSSISACEKEPPSARVRTVSSLSLDSRPVSATSSATSSLRSRVSGTAGDAAASSPSSSRAFARRSPGKFSRLTTVGPTLEEPQIGVDQPVAGEEGDEAAKREEGPEGDRHLARGGAVADEQDGRGHERTDHRDHHRHRHRPAEHRAQQQGKLDVAHPHAGGVCERRDEEEEERAEGAEHPLRRRVQRSLRDEHDRGGGQHDPVRDHVPLEVGDRDRDERGAEQRGDRGVRGQPEREHAGADEQRRDQLDERVLPRDGRPTAPAASAQERPRDDRDVVVPRERRLTRHERRPWMHNGAPQRHARGDHVEEAADGESRDESDGGECSGHVDSPIGVRAPVLDDERGWRARSRSGAYRVVFRSTMLSWRS